MVDRSATRMDEPPPGDDFEWVNAWAAVQSRKADAPTNPSDETPAAAGAADSPRSTASVLPERRPWRRILSIVARSPEPVVDPLAVAVAEDLPGATHTLADEAHEQSPANEPDVAPVTGAVAPNQLELDIAEIERVRDRLSAEPRALFVAADSSVPSRTSDHVPILVGGALAFTLLVVFGAAASLVALR